MPFDTLPGLDLTWAKAAVGGGEIFLRYNIYRRLQQGFEATMLSFNPACYLRFNELSGSVAADKTANGNDAALVAIASYNGAGFITDDPLARSMEFDGTFSYGLVPDAVSIQNNWDGGGALHIAFNADSDGEGSLGRLIDKWTGWRVYIDNEGGGLVRIVFEVDFDGAANGLWVTATNVALNGQHKLSIYYNSDAVGNNPTFVLDGIELTVGSGLTENTTPVGTRVTDVGSDLYVGNDSTFAFTFDGHIAEVALFPTTQTTAEAQYIQARTGVVSDTFIRVAIQEDLDFLAYRDYQVHRGTIFEYAVTQSVQVGGDVIESVKQSPPVADSVTYETTFAHVVGNDPEATYVQFENAETIQLGAEQKQEFLQPWGRAEPVAYIGEAKKRRFSITAFESFTETNELWDVLYALLESQKGTVLCLRPAHSQERIFCTLVNPGRADRSTFGHPTSVFQEVFYSEVV